MPGWNVFCDPFATPVTTRSTIESTNISVWMPRFLWLSRLLATAFGTPPMPSWMQAPSGIIPEISSPIALSSSRSGGVGSSSSAASCSTIASTWETCTQPVPCTRGMFWFTSATTYFAFAIAATLVSTFVPRLM